MRRFTLLAVALLLTGLGSANATMTYLRCLGVDSNFTMVQGDTFTWHADCDSGADVWVEIWVDLNGNRQIDEGTDYAWQEGFTQTDGSSGSGGPGDMDGATNGEIYFEMEMGLAAADWILRATDLTDSSTQTCWGTVTPLPDPFRVITGTVSGPGAFDPALRFVEVDENGQMWMAVTDSTGVYFLSLDSNFSVSDTVGVEGQDVEGYVAPAGVQAALADGDTVYNTDLVYTNPAAVVSGVLKDDRDSVLSGDIYIWTQPKDGGDNRSVLIDSAGGYTFYFGPSDVGQEWRFGAHYEGNVPDHMEPGDTSFQVDTDDTITHDIIALYCDSYIYGTVTENGGAPSQAYKLDFQSNAGGNDTYSDETTGVYMLPISSTIDTGQGSIEIDTSTGWSNGTPLPAGYTVEGDWHKGAAAGDSVDFNVVQSSYISVEVLQASDSTSIGSHEVELRDWTWSWNINQDTDSSGITVFSVSPGDYRVRADERNGYIGQWYDGQENGDDAETLSVNPGETLTVVFYLEQGSSILGQIMAESDSSAINGHGVEIRDAYTGDWIAQANADSNGDYAITGINGGAYFLRAFGDNGYTGEYYNDAQDQNSADTIFINTGETLYGYDFYLGQAVTVSGYVYRAADTMALDNINVEVKDVHTDNMLESRNTDSTGYYEFNSLGAGDFYLQIYDQDGYIGEIYNDVQDVADAETLYATSGSNFSGKDFYLTVGGTISGYVRDESDSSAIHNMNVELRDVDGRHMQDRNTDSTGYFEFTGLSGGDYKVAVSGQQGYMGESYDDKSGSMDADTISLSAGETRSDIDFYLASGSSISGYVMDESDSSIITNIQVKLYDAHGGWLRDEQTDSAGQYVFDGLSDGDYKVMAETDQGYAGEWYDDAANQNDADTLVISGGADVTGVDFYLSTGSSLSGYVYAESDSSPVYDMQVELRDWNWMFNTTTRTDTAGYFSFDGLAAGAYRMEVHSGSGMIGEWFDGQGDEWSADTILIGDAIDTTGFDVYLAEGAYVSGTVRKDVDSGAVNCEVRFENALGTGDFSNWTDHNGDYFFAVAPGTYFARVSNVPSGLSEEEYNDQPVGAGVDTLVVAAGDTLSGIDFYLAQAGAISGRLMQYPDSSVLGYEEVYVFDASWNHIDNAWTDGSGDYLFEGLSAGTYYVRTNIGWLVNQYYDGVYDSDSASGIPVTAGDTVTGIDFLLNSGGYIAGYVTSDSSGNSEGISGVEVQLYRTSDTTMSVSQYNADHNGFFIFNQLDIDDYYVRTNDMSGSWVNEYYDGQDGFAAANPVPMNSPPDTIWANIGLDIRRGALAGTVTVQAGGAPVQNADVSLYDANSHDDDPILTVQTDASGSYMMADLPVGNNYQLLVEAADLNYVNQWYSGQLSHQNAHSITVYEDSTMQADFSLDSGSVMSGYVYNSLDTSAVESAMVILLLASDSSSYAEVQTDAAGAYSIPGVPATDLLMACYAGYLGFGTAWWENAVSIDSADVITLSAAQDTAGFDYYLQAAGSVSGTVASDTDSSGLDDMRVTVYDGNHSWVMDASTDSSGAYTVDGLVPGTYFIEVENDNGHFGEWYSDQPDFGSADTVELVNASDSAGFDFYLTPASEVGGQIFRAADSVRLNTDLNLLLINVDNGDSSYQNYNGDWYRFQDLPAGNYVLDFSTGRYLDIVTDTFTVYPGETATQDLYLNPRMVINEIKYSGTGQDSTHTNPEFVELYVVDDLDIQNWQVTDRQGNNFWISGSRQASAGDLVVLYMGSGNDTTMGSVHNLYFNQSDRLDDNSGYMTLEDPSGWLADVVVYNSPSWSLGNRDDHCGWPNDGNVYTDGGASVTADVWSISLLPDGDDRNNGDNWVMSVSTPGAANEEAVSSSREVSGTGTVQFDGLGVDMDVLGITGSDSIFVSVHNDSFPPNLPGGNPVKMVYDISAGGGISGFTVVLTLTYTQEAFDASDIADEASLYAARWTGSEWQPLPSVVDTGANTVTCTTTAFSMWSLGGSGGPVPVELASFTAEQQGTGVALAWTTVSEQDNLGWNVYRKTADGAYEKVNGALVAGAGTAVGMNGYSFIDETLPAGCCGTVSYYLEQLDVNGGRTLSPVVSVELEQTSLADRVMDLPVRGLTAGPNPFHGTAAVSFTLERRAQVRLAVYHADGSPAAVLTHGVMAAGAHRIAWDGRDASGTVLQGGLYLYGLTIDGKTVTGSLLKAGE